MKTQLDFARETRSLERQALRVEKDFLAYVADTLKGAGNLSTAEKYTLLTAFVQDFAAGGRGDISAELRERAGADPVATKLAAIRLEYMTAFGYIEKMDAIDGEMNALDREYREWEKANRSASPLLP